MPPQYQSPSVADTSFADGVMHDSLPPRWVRWVFRGWAVLLGTLILSSVVGSTWALYGLFEENVPVLYLALFSGILISLLLQLLYVFHLFRLRRWTLVPSLALACIAIVSAYQSFYLPLLPEQEWVIVAAVALALWFSCVALLTGLFYQKFKPTRWGAVWGGLLMFILLPYLAFAIATLVIKDIPEVYDTDLLVETVSVVPPDENIYYAIPDLDALEPKTAAVYERIDEAIREARRNDAELSSSTLALLATQPMQALLQEYLTALERPFYQCPTSVNNMRADTLLCSLSDYRMLGVLANLESERLMKNGFATQSTQYLIPTLRFADSMQTEQLPLIQYLVAIALFDITYDSLVMLHETLQGTTSTTTLVVAEKVVDALKRYEPSQQALGMAFRSDHMTIRSADSAAYEDELGLNLRPGYFWQPNRTTQAFADLTRMTVQHSQMECGSGADLAEQIREQVLKHMASWQSYWEPNQVGRLFLATSAASQTNVRDRYCEAAERHEKLLADFRALQERAAETPFAPSSSATVFTE